MKAITVQQPMAWAIIHAGKNVENRSWDTPHRGWIAVHAGKKKDSEWRLPPGVRKPREEELHYGAFIGFVKITDVADSSRSKWYIEGQKAWKLSDPIALKNPVECNGKQKLWNIPPSVVSKIKKQLSERVMREVFGS